MFLRQICALLALLSASFYLSASEATPGILTTPDTVWVEVNPQNGLITALPTVTPDRLIQQMGSLRSDLQGRKARLSRKAEAKKFTTKDGIITAILPGGLLYAAVKKQRHWQAVSKVKMVDKQLADLNQNLDEFRASGFGTSIVATLH